jgi:transglutaminase-like putative cysteine protease
VVGVRFQATHKLMSYLLVSSALLTLASSDALPATAALLFFLFAALSWFCDTGGAAARLLDRASLPLRALALGFLALTIWQVWRRLPDPDLTPVLNLVMFLLGYKLFQRRTNRDYLHIYVLSFLVVLAAAALAHSFLFAFGFAIYVVMATWTLILFHLRREMEENYLVKHSAQAPSQKVGVNRILNSRRVVGRSFLGATALVAMGVFAGAVATFAVVPRIGAGFVLGTPRTTRNMVGFSDEVALGQHGVLSMDNQAVALRATVPRIAALGEKQRDREIDHLYWRGTVYDTYDSGRWVRSRRPEQRTRLDDIGTRVVVREPRFEAAHGALPPATGDRQEIDVVGLSVPVAFALDHPVAFELPATKIGTLTEMKLSPRWSGEVALRIAPLDVGAGDGDDARGYGGAHYVAYSRDTLSMARAGAGRPLRDLDPETLAPYLALPTSLTPRVAELARRVTAGRATPAAKLLAIVDWLRTTHGYTNNLKRNPAIADPLEDFLFEQKDGHCEYFASATAVLLRAAGVPSRYVNGFLGGEWNDIGHYITVRDNRAHSWAEAYLGELGWMRVDATPPASSFFRMGKLRQLVDSIDFFWGRWVVGYDLGRQMELARRLGGRLGLSQGPGDAVHGWRRPSARPALLALAVAALAAVLWRLRRRTRWAGAPGARLPRRATPVARLYERALARLARAGLPRRPSETPHEFAARVAATRVAGNEALQRLTDLYAGARFGGRPVDGALLDELAGRLGELGRPAPPAPTRP